ncbi:hypothetical protein KIPB_011595, partial [Kipferlia bialata]
TTPGPWMCPEAPVTVGEDGVLNPLTDLRFVTDSGTVPQPLVGEEHIQHGFSQGLRHVIEPLSFAAVALLSGLRGGGEGGSAAPLAAALSTTLERLDDISST